MVNSKACLGQCFLCFCFLFTSSCYLRKLNKKSFVVLFDCVNLAFELMPIVSNSDVDEPVKSLNERCEKHYLIFFISIATLCGWQPGIQEGAADWDNDWDKLEDRLSDAALVLEPIAGIDINDKATIRASKYIPKGGYAQFPKKDGQRGKRLGLGVPFGICFGVLKGSEPKLIEIAYSFEQATMIRKPPPICKLQV
ncbi:hypothetical protein VNO77_01303 [Canavalia gladiata]|uniref:Uncharacterized protein n=1 Tax=Canavalia gladiata TaxID=3824 RepID=A0AAN9MXH4_CANGL